MLVSLVDREVTKPGHCWLQHWTTLHDSLHHRGQRNDETWALLATTLDDIT